MNSPVRNPRSAIAALRPLAAACVLGILAAGCAERPAHWAEPVRRPGLRNFHRVDEGLYRSAQITAAGVEELETLGIRTVLNLRPEETDRALLEGSGIALVRQPCRGHEITEDHLVRFLEVAVDPERRPVLVHCRAGADRTGAMVAAYRVAVQDWTREEAVREMRKGGFSFHGLTHGNLVELILGMDVAGVRRRAGIAEPR